jgi:hypothetical protein
MCNGIEGLHSSLVLKWIDQGHKYLHQWLDIPDALASESFTWATTDGNEKTITSDLTRFQGKPHWVSDASSTNRWKQRSVLEMRERQTTGDLYYDGSMTFGVVGTTKMIIGAAPTEDLTVTVIHYQQPADLDDMTDTPVLPAQFHRILIDWGESRVYNYAEMMASDATTKRAMQTKYADAMARFQATYRKLVVAINKDQDVNQGMEPGPEAVAARRTIADRRSYW